MRFDLIARWSLAFAFALRLVAATVFAEEPNTTPTFQQQVETDWAKQEKRLGRTTDGPAALKQVFQKGESLLSDLRDRFGTNFAPSLAVLKKLRKSVESSSQLTEPQRSELYRELRCVIRDAALKNPLLSRQPIAFMKRNRFVCQMLHEYLGYFYDYGNVAAGGGVFVLAEPGQSLRTRDLINGRLPPGNYATLAASYDGATIYFAFAERAPQKPDFYSKERRAFHIYAVSLDGAKLDQLTNGAEDDFDPCPLPDGGIAFISSRRGAFCRCNNPWEPIPTYTLHRMNPDGSGIQTLSFHETNEWHPFVMNDGRIIYTRWDYVDRSAANFHGLWISNPDGSNPISLFGNYTMQINACYQPRAIPGSDKILFLAGAHHADVGGSMVLLDPKKVRLDPRTGEDDLGAIEKLSPEICFAEAKGWPKSYFHSPWPLSEEFYLTAFSFDPLPGMSSGETRDNHTGLYYFDKWGNLELLYQDAEMSSMFPVPLGERAKPPVVPCALNADLGDQGEFFVGDVRRSLFGWPDNRRGVELRVFQVLPKTESHIVNDPRIGYANAESARMFLGSAPIEADGSAYFKAPARKPLYFQVVDETGRAIQSMRSITYLQPGERRSCVGCHEGPNATPVTGTPLAARRAASVLREGPPGSQPMSFSLLVQPVLGRQCVRCHGESSQSVKPVLVGRAGGQFSVAYENLKPFVRWYEWGGASISQIATYPGHIGADESPLTRILSDPTHAALSIPQQDLRQIYLWLDANAPFYGVYEKSARFAQRSGAVVAPPQLQ